MAQLQQTQAETSTVAPTQTASGGTAFVAPQQQLRGNAAAQETVGTAHVVEQGDTLSGIAAVYLGSGARWPEIYDENIDTIGPNPDFLLPGQRLTLPATASGAITDAEVGAWLQPEIESSELAGLAVCEDEKPESLTEQVKEILVGIVHDALGVQIANAPAPDSCIVPSRSEVEVVIDQALTFAPVPKVVKGKQFLDWGWRVAKAGLKKLVEVIGL